MVLNIETKFASSLLLYRFFSFFFFSFFVCMTTFLWCAFLSVFICTLLCSRCTVLELSLLEHVFLLRINTHLHTHVCTMVLAQRLRVLSKSETSSGKSGTNFEVNMHAYPMCIEYLRVCAYTFYNTNVNYKCVCVRVRVRVSVHMLSRSVCKCKCMCIGSLVLDEKERISMCRMRES